MYLLIGSVSLIHKKIHSVRLCISREHLSNCRKKTFLLQMHKMDIKSVLYPLPNKNPAMHRELSVSCSSSPGVRAVVEAQGVKQSVPVQSGSHPRAGAELCWCLSPGSKAAAASCALTDSRWLCQYLLGFIQLIPCAGVPAAGERL